MISVLVPAYNAAPFLPSAFASVASQTHSNWELIVAEDGSNDGTRSLTADFARRNSNHRISYENSGSNLGVAATRNRLLALSKGGILAFLDADDLWSPTHLSDLHTALSTDKALAFAGIQLWDGDRGKAMDSIIPSAAWLTDSRLSLFQRSFIQTSSCVAMPRATASRIGHFDASLRIGEDRDYWFRALGGGNKLAYTGKITCRYTKHAQSSMTKTLQVASDTVAFYKKYRNDISIPITLRRRMLAESLWIQGRLTRKLDRSAARNLFRAAVREWPLAPRYWSYLAA